VTGWLVFHPTHSPLEDIPFQDIALALLPPSMEMEPTKVPSEGGLNVTLTIRLLMHGKVSRQTFYLALVKKRCDMQGNKFLI